MNCIISLIQTFLWSEAETEWFTNLCAWKDNIDIDLERISLEEISRYWNESNRGDWDEW